MPITRLKSASHLTFNSLKSLLFLEHFTQFSLLILALGACSHSHKDIVKVTEQANKPAVATPTPLTPQDETKIQALVTRGSPVTIIASLAPDTYADSMTAINSYQDRGLLRVVFNPNSSNLEIDTAPIIVLELSPDLFSEVKVTELLSHFSFEAATINRDIDFMGLENVDKAKLQSGSTDGYIPLDAMQARNFGGTGRGVTVAVVDTGIDLGHPYLQQGPNTAHKIVDFADFTGEVAFSLDAIESAPVSKIFESAVKFSKESQKTFLYKTMIREQRLNGFDTVSIDLNGDGLKTRSYLAMVYSNSDLSKAQANEEVFVGVDLNGNGTIEKEEIVKAHQGGKGSIQLLALGLGRNLGLRSVGFKVDEGFGSEKPKLMLGLDGFGHGTHVAGIIGGYQKGNDLHGVAPDVNLMAVRVLNSKGSGTDAAVYQGMIYAASHGADIVNLSLGGGNQDLSDDPVLPKLVRFLSQRYGTLFVAAAGNSGPTMRTSHDPGNFETMLTVGAFNPLASLKANYSDQFKNRAEMFYWSSRGPNTNGAPKPDVIAPGGIVSSIPETEGTGPIAMFNGTSMATPMTVGAAALVLESARKQNISLVLADSFKSVSQRPLAMKRAMQEGAQPLDGYAITDQGYGVVQVENSIAKLKAWDEVFKEQKKDNPEYRLFRYLAIAGDFLGTGVDSESKDHAVTITAQDDISLPRFKRRLDVNVGIDAKASADWITLSTYAGQSSGNSLKGMQTFKPGSGFRYRLTPRDSADGKINSAWIELTDSATGIPEGRVLITDVQPIMLDARPQLLADGVTAATYIKRFNNEHMKAGELRRYFVRIPKNMTGLGVHLRAQGNGAGYKPAAVAVFMSNFSSLIAQDTAVLDVRDSRARKPEGFVSAPVEEGNVIEVALFAVSALPESSFSLEFRASGLAAAPIAMLTKSSPQTSIEAKDSLLAESYPVAVRASPWLSPSSLGVDKDNPKGIPLMAGHNSYFPVVLSGELLLQVVSVEEETEVRFSLLNKKMESLKEGVDYIKTPRQTMLFNGAVEAIVAIQGPVSATADLHGVINVLKVFDFGPTVSLVAGSDSADAMAMVSAEDMPDSVSLAIVEWSDSHLGPNAIQKSMVLFNPQKGEAQSAERLKETEKVRKRLMQMTSLWNGKKAVLKDSN